MISLNPLKTWFDEAKLWILMGAIAFAFAAYEVHGHKEFKAGEATRDQQIAALKADYNTKLQKAQDDAKAKFDRQSAQIAAAQTRHEQEMKDAKDNEARTVADLRSGYLKLRRTWVCPAASAVSQAASGGPGADAAADDRAKSAAAIVRAADEADAQIRALQAIVTADRQ